MNWGFHLLFAVDFPDFPPGGATDLLAACAPVDDPRPLLEAPFPEASRAVCWLRTTSSECWEEFDALTRPASLKLDEALCSHAFGLAWASF